jgi:hypothetical protein
MPYSLATSLSMVAELLKSRVDAAVGNMVRWGTQTVLVTALSHFSELGAELELLRSSRNVTLIEDQVDALWILVRLGSDLLVSFVLPSVARCPPDGMGK